MKKYIGVDIGGTKCAVVLGNAKGEILEKVKFPTAEKDETIAEIIRNIKQLKHERVEAIGVSCGGPLNSRKGLIQSPPNLIGWDNVPVCDILTEEFKIPVYLQNDANACTVAEWKFGAGKGYDNVIFLTFGTGMGAGLILNGRLYTGRNDNAGEVGHIRLENFGPVGYGKAGSFEGFCSGGGIAQLAQSRVLEIAQSGRAVGIDPITAKTVAQVAEQGKPWALEIYEKSAAQLGRALAILMDILNPDIVVIGSIYARSVELMKSKMEEIIRKEVLSSSVCPVFPASLGESLGDIAALSVAINGKEQNV